MADDDGPDGRLRGGIRWAASVVAPLSVLTAILFYFGYASSRARYAYFGLDVDTIGLGTQDYVMRSPQALLTPLLVLLLLSVAVATVHEDIRRQVGAARAAAADPDVEVASRGDAAVRAIHHRLGVVALAGRALLGAGALLLVGYAVVGEWPFYPLLTPLLMGLGAALALYAGHACGMARPQERPRAAVVLTLGLVLLADLFWATATLAEWSGRGAARQLAVRLDRLPTAIVDTRERLAVVAPGIRESVLPASQAQTFHYRYRGLHLLIQGKDRLFLVPGTWSPSDFTLVLPMDGAVRLQFQFENSPP